MLNTILKRNLFIGIMAICFLTSLSLFLASLFW